MPRALLTIVAFVAISAAVPAQAPEPPITDTRLTVHTLLREDIFAGFLQSDIARMARAEKNADLLLASRPADRPKNRARGIPPDDGLRPRGSWATRLIST